MPKISGYLVPFSHMDLFWMGAQEECLSRGNRVIIETINMVQKHDEFRFLIEDLVFVDHFLKCHPEKKDELKELVLSGKIEIGPKWAGIDQTPQIGEDLVRNSLYALDYLEKEFNYTSKTMHTGDLPGWTPQYPQIANKLGIPYIVYTRTGPTDVSLFYWAGLDGTKSLVWYSLNGYGFAWRGGGLDISVEKAMQNGLERDMKNIIAQGHEPIFVHWGVDLILPGKKLPENLKKWNELSDLKMVFATPTEYFENAPKSNLREISGEAPSAWPYSDPQYPKFMTLSIPSIAALASGEAYSAIAWHRGIIKDYPSEKIKESWLQVLEAMDHNNNGLGFEFTLKRKTSYYENSIHVANRLTENALRYISENVIAPFGSSCCPLVVFNPTSWNRTDVVKAHATYHGDIVAWEIDQFRKVKMLDEDGNPVEFQQTEIREGVSREEYIRFTAKDVPAFGYKTFYIMPAEEPPKNEPMCRQEGLLFTTPFYSITVDKVTGEISIVEKGQKVISKMYVVGIEELMENGSFKDFTTGRRHENIIDSVTLKDNGCISATIEIKGRIGKSKVLQKITFYNDIKKIDITNIIDFEEWRPLRIEQVFDTGIENPAVTYGVPYGISWPDNVIPNCAPKREDEMPTESWQKLRNCIQWLDLTGNASGLTIGSKHRCFSIDRDKGTVNAAMLRAVMSNQCVYVRNGKKEPYPRPAPGRYTFYYTLLTHENDWAESKSYRAGWDFNYPLIPVFVDDAVSPKHLPAHDQFLKLESNTDSLILTVFKKAENSEDLIVRFYETEGKSGHAYVYFDGKKVEKCTLCNLREKEIAEIDPPGKIKYDPFEIITLKIETAK